MSLPEISITVLGEDERKSTIKEFCHGKIGVIDLWHTKCQKCPAALDKLNTDAGEFDSNDVIFIACALSLGSGNKEDVADLALELVFFSDAFICQCNLMAFVFILYAYVLEHGKTSVIFL